MLMLPKLITGLLILLCVATHAIANDADPTPSTLPTTLFPTTLFPTTIETRYGKAVIPQRPKRVISLGYTSHDFILALGVKPIALRHWYGDHPKGVWPWAEPLLEDAQPQVMWGNINIEQIASLKPDLIVAIMSGITPDEYRFLNKIAPTLVGPPGSGAFNTSWQTQTRMLGKALGEVKKSEQIIRNIDNRLAKIRKQHPEWEGKSAVMSWAGSPIVIASFDPRAQLLASLGFRTPAFIDELVDERSEFHATISEEMLLKLDADVLLWVDVGDNRTRLRNLPLRRTLRAWREGREIYLDAALSAAFSHVSPLSIMQALDELVPLLEQAADGNPNTQVRSMKEADLLP